VVVARKLSLILPGVLVLLSGMHLFFAWRTNLFFSLDDFAVLAYFKGHTWIQMVEEFVMVGDVWGFRKILGYIYLRAIFDIFGVNAMAYTVGNHILHTVNVLLVYLVVTRLSENKWQGFFGAIVFNSTYLFYFSNVHEYLVTTLSLFCIYLFLVSKQLIWPALFFILALLTKELALSLPFGLIAISIFRHQKIKKTYFFWLIALFYGLYQLSFVISKASLPVNHTYATTFRIDRLVYNLKFYMPWWWVSLVVLCLPWAWRRRSVAFLATFIVSLVPALVLKNRQESYYWYLPSVYLVLYLGTCLPKLNIKTSVVYLGVFLLLGGRSLLPKVARQNFPNWQLESIREVVALIEEGVVNNPRVNTISLSGINLERDARLMLGSDVTDLFLQRTITDRYQFTYNQDLNVVQVVDRK